MDVPPPTAADAPDLPPPSSPTNLAYTQLADSTTDEELPSDADEELQSDEPTEPRPAGELDPLADLAARSQIARLSAADEDQMSALLKEALMSGKSGLASAIENLPKLPWIVGVRAVEGVWPEMKVTTRAQLLKGLADNDSDAARRVRLSLARGLHKQDPATGLKLALGVCKEIKEKETGVLTQKHAQIFGNVLIGKVKPWLGQIALADLKPADADLLVHCAIMAVFSLPHPPIAQLGILRWAGDAGRLAKLHEAALAVVIKSVSRWSGRWQNALRNEVTGLPEEILNVLKPANGAPAGNGSAEAPDSDAEQGEPSGQSVGESGQVSPENRPRKERPVYEPRPQKPAATESPREQAPRERGNRDRDRDPEREQDRDQRKERPVYQGRGAGQNFNLVDSLRQIEAHVASLRTELSTAQSKLKQRDDDGGRKERRPIERATATVIPGEPTPEELARLNVQLEARIMELQQRLEELGADSEDRAASMGAHGEQKVTDADQQLRTLLGLKLQEDLADFLALENESTSVVVQQHYRSLLGHIFEVLKAEGITFPPTTSH